MTAAQIVRPQGTAVAVNPAEKTLAIRPGEYVIGRWKAVNQAVAPMMSPAGQAWSLGFGFIGHTKEGREIRFRPVLETSGGLRLSGQPSVFKGIFFVGLQDLADPAAQYALPQPIALLVSAQADEVSPRQFTISHTNLPFTEIAIVAQNPADVLDVSVQAAGTVERATIAIPVVRPRLEISSSRSWIQGFGLEQSEVAVRAVGLTNPAGRVATIASDFGSIEPARVTLDDQGTAVARLRSVSIGVASITATSPPLASATGTVRFGWPIAFLVASTLGGLVGAFLGRSRQPEAEHRRRRPSTVALIGILTGFVVVALFAVGVNVLPVQPTATAGEALVFALGAVGAYVGLRL